MFKLLPKGATKVPMELSKFDTQHSQHKGGPKDGIIPSVDPTDFLLRSWNKVPNSTNMGYCGWVMKETLR